MRNLKFEEIENVTGGRQDIYYDMGHAVGQAYWAARYAVGDFYMWLGS